MEIGSLYRPPLPYFKEGFLTKQGKVRKNWKRRWFILSYDKILYYDDKSERIKGFLLLPTFVSVQENCEDKTKKSNSFALEVSSRTLYLQADTNESRKSWIEALSILGDFNVRMTVTRATLLEEATFFSFESQVLVQTKQLILNISSFLEAVSRYQAEIDNQKKKENVDSSDISSISTFKSQIAPALLLEIKSSLVASDAPYIPWNFKAVITEANKIKNIIIQLVVIFRKYKHNNNFHSIMDSLKGCKTSLESISELIAPEFLEDIKFYAKTLVKSSLKHSSKMKTGTQSKKLRYRTTNTPGVEQSATKLDEVIEKCLQEIGDPKLRQEFQDAREELNKTLNLFLETQDEMDSDKLCTELGKKVSKTVYIASTAYQSNLKE